MTGRELAEKIGKAAQVRLQVNKSALVLPVVIRDCRCAFGRIDYQVEYSGQFVWVSENQISVKEAN